MKPKTNIKSIWIITILSLVLLIFSIRQCNAQPYLSFQFDVNNLLEIKDNKRMIKQVNGLDYDIELGVITDERDGNIGVYLFYGAFPNAFYRNYGFGLDLYLVRLKRLKMSLGNFYQNTKRVGKYKYLGNSDAYFNPRGKISYDTSWITIELIAKLTKRNDINKRIFEGQIGITKKLN